VFLLNKEEPVIVPTETYPWFQWLQGIFWTAENCWLLREDLTGSKFMCTWFWVGPMLPWYGVPLGRWHKRQSPFVEFRYKCSE